MIGNKEQTDVIVIGSGVTGMAAAVTAAEGGAKVIVFEKQQSLGGTSNFFSGLFAVETERQRINYITYSRDEAFKNIMEYSHWRANARLVRAVVNESAETVAWFMHYGVEFRPETINMPESPRTYHPVKGQGASIIKALATAGKERGVRFEPGVTVRRIVKEGGRIAGVVAEKNDEEIEFAARAVIIASGGYANNKEWIKKYCGFDLNVNMTPIGNVDKMGDGIRMAFEAGAAEEGLGVLETFSAGPFGPDYVLKGSLEMVGAQPDLWVDPRGERYCDESVSFYDTSMGNASARYKEGFTYRLSDDSILQILMEKGIEKQVGMDNPVGTRPVDFARELKAALERGSTDVFAADSIEELAEKMGVEKDVLKATVEEYNNFCARGHDELFAKDRKYLRPLKGPKFYAIRARCIFLGTLGGIKINHRAEVIDKKGNIIPGLYAGGFDAGGMWGDSYCIKVSSGLSAGFAANSGRIAGKNVLKYLGS
ncbi:MAG TPA: FAD-dependent oxidoreductase [Syntrophorhabdaceae bacterium]|nr:FAD-dependent oxidoreductase [Syntrophorhabdaceae bacterium]